MCFSLSLSKYYYFDCIQPLLAESISVHDMRLEWAGRSHVASERHGGGRAVEKTGCSFCLLSLALGAFRVCSDLILPAIPVLWQHETDIGFQGFVTLHYLDTESFIALAYCETHADAGVSIVLNTLMVSPARISMRLPW